MSWLIEAENEHTDPVVSDPRYPCQPRVILYLLMKVKMALGGHSPCGCCRKWHFILSTNPHFLPPSQRTSHCCQAPRRARTNLQSWLRHWSQRSSRCKIPQWCHQRGTALAPSCPEWVVETNAAWRDRGEREIHPGRRDSVGSDLEHGKVWVNFDIFVFNFTHTYQWSHAMSELRNSCLSGGVRDRSWCSTRQSSYHFRWVSDLVLVDSRSI